MILLKAKSVKLQNKVFYFMNEEAANEWISNLISYGRKNNYSI